MQKPPEGGLWREREGAYFDAAFIAAEAAAFADEAASAAEVAAEEAAIEAFIAAEAVLSLAGGVVTTVVEVDGVGVVVAGGVIVVVDSSFLLQAANETAAARVTISNAVFMFLLDFKVRQCPVCGNPLVEESQRPQDKESPSISSA